jgi:hypothetical protein
MRAARFAVLLIAALGVGALLGGAFAQPYAADDGFDRPRPLVAHQERPAFAVVVDQGEALLVRVDRGRVIASPLGPGAPLQPGSERVLASGTTFWDVMGASGGGSPAVIAWYTRDFTTGRYLYDWHAAGETKRLFEAPQPLDVRLVVTLEGPEAWVARGEAGGGRLLRWRWSGSEPEVVLTSHLGLDGLDVGLDREGRLHVAYLEGFTDVTDFGVQSEWNVRYLEPGAAQPVDLGPAAPPPGHVRVVPDTREVVFTGVAGDVRVGGLDAATRSVGRGRPIGMVGDRLLWFDGASIVTTAWPLAGARVRNAAWSPQTIDRAAAVRDGSGVTYLAWAGRRVGSGYALFASDDATAMTPTFTDRVAALFGWTPWSVAEEAFAQAAGALLTGIIATFVLLPLLWLLAAIAVRRLPHHRTRAAGVGLALVIVGAALLAVAAAPTIDRDLSWSLAGLPWAAPIALLVGAGVALLVLRRLDAESLQTLVVSAGLTTFVTVTLLTFATFQAWLGLFGM